jgi:2-C-methyl-D-erythritol 4-phosphate cytidylyltransferase
MKSEKTSVSAVLLAAGGSTRMSGPGQPGPDGSGERKPFLVLEGRTVIEHACAAFDRAASVREIVIVGHRDDLERLRQMARTCPSMRKVKRIVAGGELRSDSTRAGVEAVAEGTILVAIHDVARPLVSAELIERAVSVAAARGAAVVATPVTNTIKTSSDGEHAERTLDRSVLWGAQTPQVFTTVVFRELLAKARAEGFRPTDDAALHEKYLGPVPIVRGDPHNLKITTPEDLVLAAAILRNRASQEAPRR